MTCKWPATYNCCKKNCYNWPK